VVTAALAQSALAAELLVPQDFATVQGAIDAAEDGDTVIVAPGTYGESINPLGKAITIRSTDPADPAIVEQTILDGGSERVVTVISGERMNTIIDGFTITGGSADLGGGIGILGSEPIIRRCVFLSNTASNRGGGAYVYNASPRFDRCTFRANSANEGGGAFIYSANYARFDGCTFLENSATSEGGAYGSTFATTRFDRCLFAENDGASRGGAYAGDNSLVLFVNSLLRDNIAVRGGALYLPDTAARFLNSTVVRNSATAEMAGGAVDGFGSQPIFRNSIVRGNAPLQFAGYYLNPTGEYNNVEGGLPGETNIDADPLFVDPEANDFRLQSDSPSVDTGFNGWVPSYASRDLNEDQRVLDTAVDMGAFEFQVDVPPTGPKQGQLIATVRDEFSNAYGLDQPLLLYDLNSGEWSELVRDLPAYAIAADSDTQCFWVQSGENGLFGRVSYDTLELEEIGLLKYEGGPSFSLSGMAVVDGVLYASAWSGGAQPDRIFTIDTATATMTLVAELPEQFETWDLAYDEANDRLLTLSSSELMGGPAGVYELDLDTAELTLVQEYSVDDPFSELNGLQGLAVGAGQHFLFRPRYNNLPVYDADSLEQIDALSIPGSVEIPSGGWLLGGLTWTGDPAFCPMDLDQDGAIGTGDLLMVLSNWGENGMGANLSAPHDVVGVDDMMALLEMWGPCVP
jgi:hypothetical protein